MTQPHLDRARAQSFGAVAEQYHSHRPSYPDALIDDLAALRPAQALDVGCGTGLVAAALAGRGLPVLGIEPDEQMAAVARAQGIPVEVSGFERWEDGGRRFDLLTCGAAWHWIDPALGAAKAAEVLRPGGTVARFWNYEVPREPIAAAIEEVYGRLAPNATRYVPAPAGAWADPLAESDAFCETQSRTYEWERTLSAGEWVAMASTFSDHQRMEPQRLARLQAALAEAIAALGGAVGVRGGTFVLLARRA